MKRIVALIVLRTILLGLAAPSLAGPPPAPQLQGGPASGSFGDPNDIYLEFSISGADLTLREGTRADYEGQMTGGPIQFSGKMVVHRDEGYKSFVTMSAGATGRTSGSRCAGPWRGRTVPCQAGPSRCPLISPSPCRLATRATLSLEAPWSRPAAVCATGTVSLGKPICRPRSPRMKRPLLPRNLCPRLTTERNIAIRGTVSAVDASSSATGARVLPVMEAPVLLFRNGEEWTRTLSQPPDGSYEFIVPLTTDLSVGVFLEHGLSMPPVFQVVYDQAADPIWVVTQPFDLDETTPDVLVKDINLSDPGDLYSGPVSVPADRLDDVGLTYYYAREAWQMAAILLGLEFDLPTVKIRAFSTTSRSHGHRFLERADTGLPYNEPVIELSPKYSDYSKTGGAIRCCTRWATTPWPMPMNDLPTSRANPHGGFANPTTTDSWVEGFATFYAMWTKRDEIQESNPHLW